MCMHTHMKASAGFNSLDWQGHTSCTEMARVTDVFSVSAKGLDVDGLDLVVVGPDDLAAAVHGGHRLLPPNLDQSCALVIPQCHTARHTAAMNVSHWCISLQEQASNLTASAHHGKVV